jgi:hypothetical protein
MGISIFFVLLQKVLNRLFQKVVLTLIAFGSEDLQFLGEIDVEIGVLSYSPHSPQI